MAINTSWNILKMVTSLVRTKEITHPILTNLAPKKPKILIENTSSKLPRRTPESFGISSKYIDSFFNEIDNDDSIIMNRALVVKDDAIIAEKCHYPYDMKTWNSSFSLTKTTIGLAIGFLYDEGKIDLDEKVYKILSPKDPILLSSRNLTIRDLLTMQSGSKFNEASSAVSEHWVKDFLTSTTKFKSGTAFEYNSLNTYMLSAIVSSLAQESVSSYLKRKLYDPLEINDFFYETSPEGIEEGGWGLYITPEDMAKLGILVRDFGRWKGKQIISEKWINMMSKTQVKVKMKGQNFDYGFQMWTKENDNVCCFNGLFDQDIVIFRNTGVVFVCCCSNNDAFHTSHIFDIEAKYFTNPIKENFRFVHAFGKKPLENDECLMHYYSQLNNNYFKIEDKKAVSVSILPVILQASMNTYTSGLSGFSFKKNKDEYILHIDQVGEDYNLRYNFKDGIRQTISFYKNLYECNIDGKFIRDEEGNPFLLIRLYFIEFACVRFIKFYFGAHKNEIKVSLNENPGSKFLLVLLQYQDKATEKLISGAMSVVDKDYIFTKLSGVMAPSFKAKKFSFLELPDDEKTFLSISQKTK